MDKSILDMSTDIIKGILDDIGVVIREDAKNTQPYQQKRVKPTEAIAQYMSMSPEVRQAMQQQMPDVMTNYEQKMEKLIGRYQQ